jgi:hypothetical protein
MLGATPAGDLRFTIGSVRNVGDGTLATDMRADAVGVIAFVADDDGTILEPVEQGLGASGVMHFSRRD